MSETVILALIILAGQFVVGLFTWLNTRALSAKVEVVRHQTNAMHDRLMATEYKRGADDERANPSPATESANPASVTE